MTGGAADVHPDRLAACFPTAGRDGLPEGLVKEQRFAARLSTVLQRHYRLAPLDEAEIRPEDKRLCALSLTDLEQMAHRAGIIIHARAFLQEIRGPVLAALAERFGADALDDARRHADLSGGGSAAADLDGLDAAVRADGEACLAAWIAALPQAVSQRLRLKWPHDDALPVAGDGAFIERAPDILRRLASNPDDRS